MELFLQAAAAVLVAVIFFLVLNGHSKEQGFLLTLAVCCAVIVVAGRFVQPVFDFLEGLQQVGRLDNAYLATLLKVVGIGFLSEVVAMVCADAGNATLGKSLQMLATCVILWLSVPLLESLLELIQDILGGI